MAEEIEQQPVIGHSATEGTVYRQRYKSDIGEGTIFLLELAQEDETTGQLQTITEPVCPHCEHVGDPAALWDIKGDIYYHIACGPMSRQDLAMFFFEHASL